MGVDKITDNAKIYLKKRERIKDKRNKESKIKEIKLLLDRDWRCQSSLLFWFLIN